MAIAFIVTLLIGVPIAFTLGWSALVFALTKGGGISLAIPLQMYSGVDKFVFMAIPLFMLAGELMNRTGLTERLINFTQILVGWIQGGLAHVNIIASMLFAGISGSAVADTAALGSILIPAMKEQGYKTDFSAAVTVASSTIGPIIPPSIPMIIYSMAVGGISIAGLFLAGVVPGVLIGVGMMIIAYVQAVRNKFPKHPKEISVKKFLFAFFNVLPALFMPLLIVGGVVGGVFTATESAGIAVLYALLIGIFVTRRLRWKDLWEALLRSAKVSSMIFLVISTASVLAWMLIEIQVPQMVSARIKALSSSPLVFLILLNLFLLIVGCIIEPSSAMVMLMPILSPIAASFGIHPLHLGIVVVMNLVIGLITPPVGTCLFVVCAISKLSIQKVVRAVWPYLIWQISVLLMITYVPKMALIIPFWFGFGTQ